MATITYTPHGLSNNWNDPAVWAGGVVPNDPSVDVIVPTVFQVPSGRLFVTTITETGAISVGSLQISNHNLTLNGSLSVTNNVNLSGVGGNNPENGGFVTLNSGALSVASFNNGGTVTGSGSINSAGLFLNAGTLAGNGLNLTTAGFTNTGTVSAFNLNLTVTPGGFTNLTGTTLTGGTYAASIGSLKFDVGAVIAAAAAKLSLSNGGMIYSFDDIGNAYVPITSSLHQITANGSLSLSNGTYNWTNLTVDGSLFLDASLNTTQLTVHAGGLVRTQFGGNLGGPVINDGTILVGGNTSTPTSAQLFVSGPVTGSGHFEIAYNANFTDRAVSTLRLGPGAATSQDVIFQDRLGMLVLDDPSVYSGDLKPTGAGDQIILPGISLSSVTGYSYAGNSAGGTLEVHTASGDIDLNFLGSFVTGNFALSAGPQFLSSDPPSLRITNTGGYRAGTSGDDNFTMPRDGTWFVDAGGGNDTITLPFSLASARVSYSGNTVIIDIGADVFQSPSTLPGHFVLTGIEKYVFTDGTVDNNDGNRLVDDLFYYGTYKDVWNAYADADAHYNSVGWHEGRDPSAFFSTAVYLSANPDVKASGVNPLTHFDTIGWQQGRVPSITFDPAAYLAANPDVTAGGVDPLRHYLENGYQEGRQPIAPTELLAANGFDYVYYLNHNPDIAKAGVDPFVHFQQFGWKEGRNPNALFDTNGYLNTYTDVKAANINPLDHYNTNGWLEGRDPSVGFDTTSYLAAYPDIHSNPLKHFLDFGIHEGRSPFADGVWG